jgi:hypothetical protein
MTENKIDSTALDAELSAAETIKNMDAVKQNTTGMCPVCENSRNKKGNQAKCSRITQLKGMKERGET